MKHRWGKRSWWPLIMSAGFRTTQTCARCGAKLRIEKTVRIPGTKRSRGSVRRSYLTPRTSSAFVPIDAMPLCAPLIQAAG